MQRITMWLLRIGIVGAMVVLLYILFLFWTDVVHAAESDSVYFVSATDMIAQVDSIEAVCDTTHETVEMADADSMDLDSCFFAGKWILFYRFYFEYDTIWMPCLSSRSWATLQAITCRELIAVVVVKEPVTKNLPPGEYGMGWPAGLKYHLGGIFIVSPGQMVVWWREVQ